MICPKCNSEIKDGSKFCTNCGEPLPQMKKCVECGALIKEQALFCTNCGAKQPVKEDKPKVDDAPKKNVEQPQQKVQETKPEQKNTATPKVDEKKNASRQKPVSEKNEVLPKEELKQSASKTQSNTKVQDAKPKPTTSTKKSTEKPKPISSQTGQEKNPEPPKRKKKNKVGWGTILSIVCFLGIAYLKSNYKSSQKEVYQQQYMDFSELNNAQSNENTNEANGITWEDFYNDYVFGNKDFSNIAHTICTPKLIQFLKDAYNQEYECLDGECYAMWLFRTGNPDGISNVSKVTNIELEGVGWVKVSYIDMGIEGVTYIKLISYNGQYYMDEIRRAY